MNEITELLKTKIEKNLHLIKENDVKIDGIFFSTEDGFIITSYMGQDTKVESDKMAAIISSLYGICSAGGYEIENHKAKSIIVEYDKSILLIINFPFENDNYIMAILSNKKNNIGQVLFTGNSFIKILRK